MKFFVKDMEITIEDRLAKKLDIMCDRVMKDHPALDACLENSGFEGEGKTNTSIIEAAYIQMKTGRTINLFMLTSSAAKFMQNNEKGLVILDEPSFETLSTDAMTSHSKDLLRLTSTMRVMRHFLIVNFAKFWKFPEFLVVDRALGMVHLFSKNGKEPGRFHYIRKKNLENLWNDYKKKGLRSFGKYRSFGGQFSYKMEELFDRLDINVEGKKHATFADYQKAKKKAIEAIGEKEQKKDKNLIKLMQLRRCLGLADWMSVGLSKDKIAALLGMSATRLREWSKIDLNNPKMTENDTHSLGKRGFEATTTPDLLILGGSDDENSENEGEDPSNKTKNDTLVPPEDENEL